MAFLSRAPVNTDVTRVDTVQSFQLGIPYSGSDCVYEYCKATSACSAGDLVKISSDGLATVVPGTTTLLASTNPCQVGAAQIAIASGSYAWIAVGPGKMNVFCETNCAQDVVLYTHATAGHVDDSATTRINNLKLITTITTAAVSPCFANAKLTTVGAAN